LNPDLDIVIVNWNGGAQLRECLASIAAASQEGFTLARVVVVDNGSRDGSRDGLDAFELPLTLVANDDNRGFGAASNQGAARGAATYVLFDDPANAGVGLCGIQLVDAEGHVHRSCTRHPRPRHFIARMTGLDRLAPGLFPSHVMSEWDHADDRRVDHVMGAFLLMRRALFAKLHGFDERFFVYLEDLDLSLRAKREGAQTMYLARTRAYHRSGGVSEQAMASRLYYSLHSRMAYGHKHFSRPVALALDAGTLLVEPLVRGLAQLASGRPRELGETARACARLWTAVLTGRGPVETAGA
jgi:GT2 family glycosyltransferase